MLISMCSCAPGVLDAESSSIGRVMALDFVKSANFQLVSHVIEKLFELQSSNIIGMLINMCSCAPGVLDTDSSSIGRVMALDLVKSGNFQLVSHVTEKLFDLQS